MHSPGADFQEEKRMSNENQNVPESMEEVDLYDILTDEDNHDPITLVDGDGKQLTFEQVAVIPHTVDGEARLYCILKPLDPIDGIADDEAIVFLVDSNDEGDDIIRVEEDEAVARQVFDEYYDLLREAGENAD